MAMFLFSILCNSKIHHFSFTVNSFEKWYKFKKLARCENEFIKRLSEYSEHVIGVKQAIGSKNRTIKHVKSTCKKSH